MEGILKTWEFMFGGGIAVIGLFLGIPLLGPGIHFIIPWVQSVVTMTTQVQLAQTFASSASSDNQNVYINAAVNYHILPSRAEQIYANYSVFYAQSIIAPAIQQAIKASTAEYSAPNITRDRDALVSTIQDKLSAKLTTFGIVVDSVALTNVSYSPQFTQAIENAAVAQQNLATQRNLLNITKVEANQTVAAARGNATATVLRAQANATEIELNANATAYAIGLLNAQLNKSPNYIQLQLVKQWNGGVPYYLSTGGTGAPVPLLALGTNTVIAGSK